MEFFTDIGMMLADDIMNFSNDPIMASIALVMVILVAAVSMMIAYLIFITIDSSFRKKFTTSGIVIQRGFTPEHTTIILQQVGKVMVPQNIHHPDRWSFLIELEDGETSEVDVTEEQYNSITDYSVVALRGVTGRISGSTYLTEVIGD